MAALICLMAAGCSSDNDRVNDPFARLPNKPPVIVQDSLTWQNPQGVLGDTIIQWGVSYVYSVRAIDPDFGDKVIQYFWRFGNDANTYATNDHRIPYAFWPGSVGIVSVRASDRQVNGTWVTGPEVSFQVPLPEEYEEPMTLTAMGLSGLKENYNVAAGAPLTLSFVVPDADNDDVFWKVSWGDGSIEEGIASSLPGKGAMVSVSHVFADDFVGKKLTATIEVKDQRASNNQRAGSIPLSVTR
jgi:hypothetical protein